MRTVGRVALRLALFFVAAVELQPPLRPLALLRLLGLGGPLVWSRRRGTARVAAA